MSKLILVISMIFSIHAHAGDLPRHADAAVLKPFFAKNSEHSCVLAVGLTAKDMPGLIWRVYCAFDGETNDGAKGCMFGTFEPATGEWGALNPYAGIITRPGFVGKKCSKEIVGEILSSKLSHFSADQGKDSSIAEMLKSPDATVLFDKFGALK